MMEIIKCGELKEEHKVKRFQLPLALKWKCPVCGYENTTEFIDHIRSPEYWGINQMNMCCENSECSDISGFMVDLKFDLQITLDSKVKSQKE
jgi:hypothetical protein